MLNEGIFIKSLNLKLLNTNRIQNLKFNIQH